MYLKELQKYKWNKTMIFQIRCFLGAWFKIVFYIYYLLLSKFLFKNVFTFYYSVLYITGIQTCLYSLSYIIGIQI